MGMKKLISIGLAIVLTVSLLSVSIMNTNADTATSENPNPNAEITGVEAIRNSLNLVWNDEFGGDIGCRSENRYINYRFGREFKQFSAFQYSLYNSYAV